ncbi:hypothetical protein RMR16_013570 [Agrobacterium sp. rho-13.3]|uniref:hypothetical protein n=1 Tax=Agrobacterium sp. rho-13.3 TaxID=3072980 RepID=UPI002A0D4122|nr:hypothetical protein [Agrobacterium sp. rho-13.3]MDX8309906.1 hypothetical protein [Agrobacterium sp. rho-13.3]
MTSTQEIKTAAASSAAFYADMDIPTAVYTKLEDTASRIHELGRRTTEQTFELGDHLAQVAAILPEGTFNRWVDIRCNLKARSARNYMAVFRNLGFCRDELVDLSVGSTVLFHLSSATEDRIVEAIAFANEAGRLKVADVKTIMASTNEDEDDGKRNDQFSVGGLTGLKALIALKSREGLKVFIDDIVAICRAIEEALSQKRVIKEALAKEVQDLSRVARLELTNLALFVETETELRCNARAMTFPKSSEWARVHDILYKLGGVEQWPKSGGMRDWLQLEVLPVLLWVVSKERKPKWPLERPTAAVASERAEISYLSEGAPDGVDEGAEPTAILAQINIVPPLAHEVEHDPSDEIDVNLSEEVELPTAVMA